MGITFKGKKFTSSTTDFGERKLNTPVTIRRCAWRLRKWGQIPNFSFVAETVFACKFQFSIQTGCLEGSNNKVQVSIYTRLRGGESEERTVEEPHKFFSSLSKPSWRRINRRWNNFREIDDDGEQVVIGNSNSHQQSRPSTLIYSPNIGSPLKPEFYQFHSWHWVKFIFLKKVEVSQSFQKDGKKRTTMGLDLLLFQADKDGDPELIKQSQRARFKSEAVVDEIQEDYKQWTRGTLPFDSGEHFTDGQCSLLWAWPDKQGDQQHSKRNRKNPKGQDAVFFFNK